MNTSTRKAARKKPSPAELIHSNTHNSSYGRKPVQLGRNTSNFDPFIDSSDSDSVTVVPDTKAALQRTGSITISSKHASAIPQTRLLSPMTAIPRAIKSPSKYKHPPRPEFIQGSSRDNLLFSPLPVLTPLRVQPVTPSWPRRRPRGSDIQRAFRMSTGGPRASDLSYHSSSAKPASPSTVKNMEWGSRHAQMSPSKSLDTSQELTGIHKNGELENGDRDSSNEQSTGSFDLDVESAADLRMRSPNLVPTPLIRPHTPPPFIQSGIKHTSPSSKSTTSTFSQPAYSILPFLLRNLRRGFEARFLSTLPSPHQRITPPHLSFIPPSPKLKDKDKDSSYTYTIHSPKLTCPLCILFKTFASKERLQKHVEWDHEGIWIRIRRSDQHGGEEEVNLTAVEGWIFEISNKRFTDKDDTINVGEENNERMERINNDESTIKKEKISLGLNTLATNPSMKTKMHGTSIMNGSKSTETIDLEREVIDLTLDDSSSGEQIGSQSHPINRNGKEEVVNVSDSGCTIEVEHEVVVRKHKSRKTDGAKEHQKHKKKKKRRHKDAEIEVIEIDQTPVKSPSKRRPRPRPFRSHKSKDSAQKQSTLPPFTEPTLFDYPPKETYNSPPHPAPPKPPTSPYLPPETPTNRPYGPYLYDLLPHPSTIVLSSSTSPATTELTPLPHHLSTRALLQEEEIFEMTDINPSDKVMAALWNRWVTRFRNIFIKNRSEGVKTFVGDNYKMIYRSAGRDALRNFLLVLVAQRYLTGKEVAEVLRGYDRLVTSWD